MKPGKRLYTKQRDKPRINKLDIMLIVLLATTLLFIAVIVWLFYLFQAVPDSLVAGFFAMAGGECGVLGWIKSGKERRRERGYELEDREYNEKHEKEDKTDENTDVSG